MSTNHVREANKILLFNHGEEKLGIVQVLHVYHGGNNNSMTRGMYSVFLFHLLSSASNKVE